jgi:nicotinamidase-related amidase
MAFWCCTACRRTIPPAITSWRTSRRGREMIIPPNGPNKFLPYDLEFHRYPDFDLDRVFSDHGIRTIITMGTQVQTAVLHTAAEAALRGYKVIVPVDGMSGDSLYPEQYTAWHLANTQRVMQQVRLTGVDLIRY